MAASRLLLDLRSWIIFTRETISRISYQVRIAELWGCREFVCTPPVIISYA